MKRNITLLAAIFLAIAVNAQLSISKVDGGTAETKYNKTKGVNIGTSLIREWIIINDEACPIKLNDDVGIKTYIMTVSGFDYRFIASGNMNAEEPLVAYEIHHVLYDVFGKYIKTLANTKVADMTGLIDLTKSGAWYANSNQLKEYFICVSYVGYVRTKEGIVWRYNPVNIKNELGIIAISYEEGYAPSNDDE